MRTSKTIFSLLFVALIASLIFSFKTDNAGNTALVNITIPMWEMGKQHTLEVAAAMPEEHFSYKPSKVSKTFGQQMVHIGYSLSYFSQGMMKGQRVPYNEPDASTLSKKEVIAVVEKGFDDMLASIKELDQEDLEVKLPFGKGKKISRSQAIIFAHDHVTNHRAKANLYIRMNNIEPPAYKFI